MKRSLTALTLLALAGCATPPPPAPPPYRPLPVYAPPPPVYVPPPLVNRDQCGAGALQTLVGQPRTAIPVPVNPGMRRVACTTCPVTMDYAPARLNILFDADTGVIREVKCG